VLPAGAKPRERGFLCEYIANDPALPRPECVRKTAHLVASGNRLVTVRVERNEDGGAQPCFVYMQRGAWMQGSPMTHADITMRIHSGVDFEMDKQSYVEKADAPLVSFPGMPAFTQRGLTRCR